MRDILSSVSRLRPLPTNTTRILKALDDPHTNAVIIAELIALDQALTAFILRVANSAAMGSLIATSSIKEAVMRLGFKQVRSLVLSTVAAGPLSTRLSGYRLGDKELWYHSIAVASASHWLAGALHFPDPEKAYVAGLLHDIGKLILDQYVLADYNQIVSIMNAQSIPFWNVEKQLFGIDHAAVGGLVTKHWQFPTELVEAIRQHHAPTLQQGNQRLAAIVNVANALIPQKSDKAEALEGRTIYAEALDILKLDPDRVPTLQAKLEEALFLYDSRNQAIEIAS